MAARNSLLPFRIEHMLTNSEASQHTMDVAVYAGNRALAADCTLLGRCVCCGTVRMRQAPHVHAA